ncbi:MAG: LytTR family DNA-binding domain-containing protein [Imperialibacter sp.]|uniref:LytR/AlgR family response regulator transcription factor n=1 Tax=Imperialibacter sp. TaxID=2038411 RepID=UPI0032EAD1B7
MKIRTLVIDDESAFIGNLEAMLEAKPNDIQLVGAARSVEEGLQKIDELEPDLVFLDIQMEDGTGFDLLQRCDRRDFKVVFVTAYDQFAIEAFRFSAIDYLLKPVVSDDLWAAVDKAKLEMEKSKFEFQISILMDNIHELSKDKKKLVLREAETLHVIKLEEILWCTAEGSYTTFHLIDGQKIMVSTHLKEYEAMLEKNGFFRVHRSYLVNVGKIKKFDKREGGIIYLEGNVTLPVSVRKKERLLMLLANLM